MAGHPRKTSCTKNRTKELRLSLESYIWLLGLIFWKFIRFKNFQKPLKSLESDVITDLSEYKFITVIRHPLKRLVSAYSDKIGRGSTRVSRQYYWHNYGREIISRYRKNYPKLTQGKAVRDDVRDDATKVRDRRDGSGRSRLKFQVYQLVNPFLNDPY